MKTLAFMQDFYEVFREICLLWAGIPEITLMGEELWYLAAL